MNGALTHKQKENIMTSSIFMVSDGQRPPGCMEKVRLVEKGKHNNIMHGILWRKRGKGTNTY